MSAERSPVEPDRHVAPAGAANAGRRRRRGLRAGRVGRRRKATATSVIFPLASDVRVEFDPDDALLYDEDTTPPSVAPTAAVEEAIVE